MSNEGLEEIVEKLDYNEAYGFSEKNVEYEDFEKGLSESVVRKISELKGEPEWRLQKRLTGYKVFDIFSPLQPYLHMKICTLRW